MKYWFPVIALISVDEDKEHYFTYVQHEAVLIDHSHSFLIPLLLSGGGESRCSNRLVDNRDGQGAYFPLARQLFPS
jgi:hypothetical protein